ncbi:uncharacterized protein SAPINGB_P005630 [Magnusiomyces paraingens]|uniref:JmjC domain-containing protein n=1 Tax=Magnusiomyces paraingens TaxID=2606893 RepID=A0A5E8C0N9_9ASCO|nr:uncharacterized protein SAPINGB_P005630 [Saprochaete ingens]VVT57274.1 unnamed protein product [Saprochaete ingens]
MLTSSMVKKIYVDLIKPFENHIEFLKSLGIDGNTNLSTCATHSNKNTETNKAKNNYNYNVHPIVIKASHADLNEFVCEVCDNEITEDILMRSCDECDCTFHRSCINNYDVFQFPNNSIYQKNLRSSWYCPKCLVGSCDFAFQQGDDYTLFEFEDFADSFENLFFEENPLLSTLSKEKQKVEIEKMFWNFVNSPGKSLTVEYGSDIHTDTSGFPSSVEMHHNKYSKDSWNLNNLPLHKDSLFHNITTDISGMTQPWIYIGMLFSTFCWHCEDHYTYSINYQHFGETKTWYGVPGDHAEEFEKTVKNTAPELFEKQPDLLFQLVTMVSPDVLLKDNVPCYTIKQQPGQFVITWPKVYHSGFNHGFNCNEAVNFAPLNWLPYGAESSKTYKLLKRAPVFSFDSLVIRTAKLDHRKVAFKWLYPYLKNIINEEISLRESIISKYPTIPVYLLPSDVPEEKYQCAVCQSLPYLSRVVIKKKLSIFKKRKYHNGTLISGRSHKNLKCRGNIAQNSQIRKRGRPPKTATNLSSNKISEHKTNDMSSLYGVFSDELGNKYEFEKDCITVCHSHVPNDYSENSLFDIELHLKWTNSELQKILSDFKNQVN